MWNSIRVKVVEAIKAALRSLLTTLQRAWWKLRWWFIFVFVQILEELQERLPNDAQ